MASWLSYFNLLRKSRFGKELKQERNWKSLLNSSADKDCDDTGRGGRLPLPSQVSIGFWKMNVDWWLFAWATKEAKNYIQWISEAHFRATINKMEKHVWQKEELHN